MQRVLMGLALIPEDFKKGQCCRCPYRTQLLAGEYITEKYCSLQNKPIRKVKKCPAIISKETFSTESELREWQENILNNKE